MTFNRSVPDEEAEPGGRHSEALVCDRRLQNQFDVLIIDICLRGQKGATRLSLSQTRFRLGPSRVRAVPTRSSITDTQRLK